MPVKLIVEFGLGDGVMVESVKKLCFLGDMFNGDGGADSAVVAGMRCAWKKFRELIGMLSYVFKAEMI